MSVFQSDIAVMDAEIRAEKADCPQCEQPLRREDIIITARPSGLGKPKRQHVEGHCRHCKVMASFDRQLQGNTWVQVTGVSVKPSSKLTHAEQKRRCDLEHAVRVEQVMSEPGIDYAE